MNVPSIIASILLLIFPLRSNQLISGHDRLQPIVKSEQNTVPGIGVVLLQYNDNTVKNDTLQFFASDTTDKAFYAAPFQSIFDALCATPKEADTIAPLEVLYATTSVYMRCLDSTNLRYKVCLNETTGVYAWLPKGKTISFHNWLSYFQSADYLIPKELLTLHSSPDDKAKKLRAATRTTCYEVLKIQGDWLYLLQTYCSTIPETPIRKAYTGWVRWHRKPTLLLLKMYRE